MARYIDADALISVLEDMRERHRKNLFFVSANAYDGAARIVKAMKTIEARPVVRGEWIEKPHTDGFGGHYFLYHCSRCDTPNAKKRNFCNECGADMRGEEDG